MKKLLFSLLAVCVLNGFSAAQAEDKMAAFDQAVMERMMTASTPGEHHKVLAELAGKWDYTLSFKIMPDAPAEETTGQSENTLIFGGRFLQQAVAGTMKMGEQSMPFEGMGLVGFDNMEKQFKSIWIDNMGTQMMIATNGAYDAETKTITENANIYCAMRGEKIDVKSELKIIDADHHTYTMYSSDNNGGMFKSMEISYTRVKE